MHYWFEALRGLLSNSATSTTSTSHDQSERRFVVEREGLRVGLVGWWRSTTSHRRAEFQIIISPDHQGRGYATQATHLAMGCTFTVLNLYRKLFLVVDVENTRAVSV